MQASIAAIEYYLPKKTVTTEDLSAEFPEWDIARIDAKTGIRVRHVADVDECASDMAVAAAGKLFASGACGPEAVDYILLCTQSPDHFLPTTACLVQDRLGIPHTAGAIDFNMGSSGYVYGLGLAQGLISSGQASRVLLLTAETYSKFIHPRDRSVRTVFGDGASATLLVAEDAPEPVIGPFIYGTDGSGGANLIVPAGGSRLPRTPASGVAAADDAGNIRSQDNLFMNGGEIFNFTLTVAPESVSALLDKAILTMDSIDLFVFHQANRFILDHLRKSLRIPTEKFQFALAHCGNTGSSTLPIALRHAEVEGRLHPGSMVMLVGFGPGYSWGATLVRWSGLHSPSSSGVAEP